MVIQIWSIPLSIPVVSLAHGVNGNGQQQQLINSGGEARVEKNPNQCLRT